MLDGSMTTEQNLQVKTLTEVDYKRWDEFVDNHPRATFFHRSGWQEVLKQGFGPSYSFPIR